MTRPVVLLRCSTDNQDSDFKAQRESVLPWLATYGLTVAPEDWREEPDVSGARWKRPVLERILDEAGRGEITHVICADFDRAGRSGFRTCAMVETLVEVTRITVVFVREGLILRPPEIEFKDKAYMAALGIGGMAKIDACSNATRPGMAVAKKLGKAVGKPPYGTRYEGRRATIDPATGRRVTYPAVLVPVPEELAVLRRALTLHGEFGSWQETAARLGPTTRAGKAWIPSKLSRACRNPRARAFMGA